MTYLTRAPHVERGCGRVVRQHRAPSGTRDRDDRAAPLAVLDC
ncbi:hypothetical protein [Demequina aestuarii]|nr:hypothetical protein [Demequina aestuarii]